MNLVAAQQRGAAVDTGTRGDKEKRDSRPPCENRKPTPTAPDLRHHLQRAEVTRKELIRQQVASQQRRLQRQERPYIKAERQEETIIFRLRTTVT